MEERDHFEVFKTRSGLAALAATAIALIALIAAAAWLTSVAQTAVTSVASSVLTVGLITLVYDGYLRRSFTTELLRLVGLQSNLAAAGVEEIVQEPDLRWNELLAHSTRYRILLLDPTTWIDREWPHVIASGRSRKIDVEVYLADPDGASLERLAENVSLLLGELQQRLTTAQRVLEDSWTTAARSDPPIQSGCKLTVRLYDRIPGFMMALADDHAVVITGGALGRHPGENALALRFERANSQLSDHWFEEQVARLEALAPSYVNAVA
jgi:hypothetical protein